MAIDAYTGNPRSGKSYSVVKNVILPSLREGRHVFTNIPMTEKAHQEFPGQIHQLDKDWYSSPDLADLFPAGSVVVLDELWRRWPSGMKSNRFPFKDKEFLAEHGHNVDENGNTTRVVLVTQDLADIASFARGKVDKTYRSQKLDAVGADNRFRVDIYEGCVTGQKPPKSQFIRSVFDKYESANYAYYRSSTKSQTGDVGNEQRADKRANIWRSKGLWALLAFGVLGPILGVYMLWSVYSSWTKPAEKVAPAKPSGTASDLAAQLAARSAQPAQSAPVLPAKPVEPQPSSSWRVVGYINRKDDDVREDQAAWPSQRGYGEQPPPVREDVGRWREGQVILKGVNGLRVVPLAECTQYPNSPHYSCRVDGELVTPWSGHAAFAQAFPDSTGMAATKVINADKPAQVKPLP